MSGQKLYYILTSATTGKPGSVQTKVTEQIEALNEAGISARGLFFTTEKIDSEQLNHVRFIPVKSVNSGYFRSLRQQSAYDAAILSALKETDQPDVVYYFRYTRASFRNTLLSMKYGRRMLVNHVSKERFELSLYKPDKASGLISRTLGLLEYRWIPVCAELTLGRVMRLFFRAGVSNSEEMAFYQRKLGLGFYKNAVIPDGINTAAFPAHKMPDSAAGFRMVFLKGASTAADYNGTDRILKSLAAYEGDIPLSLVLIGYQLGSEKKLISELGIEERATIKDAMYGSGLDQEMNQSHCCVSTFGSHRKKLYSNSTLKSREYCARGIPFIYGHHDPDFSSSDLQGKYCLEFPANESLIDFKLVANWLKNLIQQEPDVAEKMRNWAATHLDHKIKMQELKLFIEKTFK